MRVLKVINQQGVKLALSSFVLCGLCKVAGYDSLVDEGSGRRTAQGHVGPIIVLVALPVLDALAGIGSDRNHEAFRHSARRRPLNDAM
jgi:hypothetical protein